LSFRDIAEGCVDHYPTRFVDQFAAYKMLLDDLAAGRFKRGDGRSSVLLVYDADVLRVSIDYFDEVRTIALVNIEGDYLARCWVPREVFFRWIRQRALEKLVIWFGLIAPEQTANASRATQSTGKTPIIVEWLKKKFDGKMLPPPSHQPRKALIDEALKALPALGGKLDDATMKKAIVEYNASISRDPK
jgi:hypothetical protein